MPDSDTRRWLIAAIVALAIVALVAYARNDPGVDDVVPDPEDAAHITSADGVDSPL